mmetsp:Transcript_110207/g.312617  ORF Transcript_110207/g.312617 Transcript_110207/m.312617 type:complete len:239 (-) Transcript_110207:8-724(-)
MRHVPPEGGNGQERLQQGHSDEGQRQHTETAARPVEVGVDQPHDPNEEPGVACKGEAPAPLPHARPEHLLHALGVGPSPQLHVKVHPGGRLQQVQAAVYHRPDVERPVALRARLPGHAEEGHDRSRQQQAHEQAQQKYRLQEADGGFRVGAREAHERVLCPPVAGGPERAISLLRFAGRGRRCPRRPQVLAPLAAAPQQALGHAGDRRGPRGHRLGLCHWGSLAVSSMQNLALQRLEP